MLTEELRSRSHGVRGFYWNMPILISMKGHNMLNHKLTDTEIKVGIVPRRLRWPAPGTNNAWTKAHDCVDALQTCDIRSKRC